MFWGQGVSGENVSCIEQAPWIFGPDHHPPQKLKLKRKKMDLSGEGRESGLDDGLDLRGGAP